jgi:hypothetical protein
MPVFCVDWHILYYNLNEIYKDLKINVYYMEFSGIQIAVLVALACGTGWIGYHQLKPDESEKVASMARGGRQTKNKPKLNVSKKMETNFKNK